MKPSRGTGPDWIREIKDAGSALRFTKGVLEPQRQTDDNSLWMVANTGTVDLDGEVVVPSGADDSYFKKHGPIFYDHRWDEPPVAKLRSATLVGDSRWECHVGFNALPFSKDVMYLVKEGFITGCSVGFVPLEYGPPTKEETAKYGPHNRTVRKWKWLELSITPMPCNPDAVIRAGANGRIAEATVKSLGLRPFRRRLFVA